MRPAQPQRSSAEAPSPPLPFPRRTSWLTAPQPAAVQYQAPPCTQPAFHHPERSRQHLPRRPQRTKWLRTKKRIPAPYPRIALTAKGGRKKITKGPKNPLAGADRGPSHDEKHANRKATSTEGTLSAQTCAVPEPRPTEEPGGTVESPRGKGVAVTQRFILTLPLQSSKQREVICLPSAAVPSEPGISPPSDGGKRGHFWPKTGRQRGNGHPGTAPLFTAPSPSSGSPRH